MQPISIDDVRVMGPSPVDLFVQLSEAKFILVSRAGTEVSSEKLDRYVAKGLSYLYVRTNDYIDVVQKSISIAGITITNKEAVGSVKVAVLENALTSVYQEIQALGMSERSAWHARLVAEATLSVTTSLPSLRNLLESFAEQNNEGVRHCIMVAMMATMIAQGHGWVKVQTFEKLTLGGLLHDIGKIKIPKDILSKDPKTLTHDELIIYKNHPEIGKQMIQTVKTMPDDVILIVYEHHESADGSGFPRGLRDFQMSPLARLVSLADSYVNEIKRQEIGGHPAPMVGAMEMIERTQAQLFNKDVLKALRKMVELDLRKKAA